MEYESWDLLLWSIDDPLLLYGFYFFLILFGFIQNSNHWNAQQQHQCQVKRATAFWISCYISLNVKASQHEHCPFPQSSIRCLLFQYLLFSDLCFQGVQQQLKAINWRGGCWNCCCFGAMWPGPSLTLSFPLSSNRTSNSNKGSLNPARIIFRVTYFWSSSSWKEIPKMMGRFMMWKSTVLQWHQTYFLYITTELEKTWEVLIPPQATFTVLHC